MSEEITFETDVLVVGGGMAACWAAISAARAGAGVVLVDKGFVGTSGVTATYVAPDQRVPETIDPAAILASGELGSLRHGYRWTEEGSEAGSLDQFWRLGPLLREGAETAARRHQERHERRS